MRGFLYTGRPKIIMSSRYGAAGSMTLGEQTELVLSDAEVITLPEHPVTPAKTAT